MKALSIKQPWAWLIASGWKDVENRSWRTKFRGKFLIHAGKGFDADGFDRALNLINHYGLHILGMPLDPKDYERGGIVGSAEIVDCIEPGSTHISPWYEGQFGFLMIEQQHLPFRPIKGQLNFFEVPDV